MALDGFLEGAQSILDSVIRSVRNNGNDSEVLTVSVNRLTALKLNLERMSGRYPNCRSLIPPVDEGLAIVTDLKRSLEETEIVSRPEIVRRSGRGRPYFNIPRQQLEILVELRFSNREIAGLLHVSESVIKRRLQHFQISRRQHFSTISNEDLDSHVRRLTQGNPGLGQRSVQGMLLAEGITVQRERVAESLIRVDAASVAMRWCQAIRRRKYEVPGPNSLWHIDGNHKLVRWGFIIHGAIDGYSRLVVYLSCATNNRASTVLSSFFQATEKYGVPSRVRCDHGVENMDVAAFMVMYRGEGRGSCITGRSVHNQRIERFWRDLFHGCTNLYHSLFMYMEREGLVSTDNAVEMWCLQFVYRPRLQRDMDRFMQGWNNHSMRTVNGKSPIQLYTSGMLAYQGRRNGGNDLFFEPEVVNDDVDEETGVDWDDPLPEEDDPLAEQTMHCPLNADQLQLLREEVDPLDDTEETLGVELYLRAVSFCLNH